MEIQKQNQDQQLTVRQQMLSTRIAKVGKLSEISFAKTTVELSKIRDLDLTIQEQRIHLQQGLSMIFTKASNLLGIKDPISDINKLDIVEMILARYKSLSLEEIDYAFRLDRYSGEPTQHFQLFNAEYVGKVLNRYREWLRKTRENNNLPLKKAEEKKELTEEEKEILVINGAIACFEEFKESNSIPLGRTYVYDFLYERKMLPSHTPEFRERIKRQAIKQLYKSKDDLQHDRREVKSILQNVQIGKNNLKVQCKNLVLQEYFRRLIAQEKSLADLL